MELQNSTIAANTASGSGGGIYNVGWVGLTQHSTITTNTAGTSGGGIFNYSGTLTLDDSSSVTGNTPDDIYP